MNNPHMELEHIAEICKLLGDRTRVTILALLREKELCVCELAELLQTSQPNMSQHMRKLKSGGLVKEDKRGQWVYYSLSIDDSPLVQDVIRHAPSQKTRLDSAAFNTALCCD